MRPFRSVCRIGVIIGAAAVAAGARAQDAGPQALADRIQGEVAAIRGLPFKRPVTAANQSVEEFEGYLDRQLDQLVPPGVAEHYGALVRKLGLYRGAEDLEIRSLMKGVMTSQAAAYYDPDRSTFFVLVADAPELLLGTFYSHELYHGLQDQHFDLNAYMLDRQRDRSLNDDELLARQAVVEGEATYVMTIWAMQNVMGRAPPRGVLAEVVRQQTALDTDAMRAALRDPQAAALLGGDVAAAIEATDEIPRFVIETLMGAYVKGFAFVFAVEARGWTEVEKLYGEYPPQSTEQILHPEKWFARESPALFEWPALAEQAALADWQPLEENVLGEIQWRIVFAEHGLAAEAEAAAGGWDGDRYAVLRHRATGELLLLARTGWDSEADAEEFAGAYRRLLAVKYADRAVPTRVERRGTDVLIVEGGSDAALDAHAAFLHGASKTRR